MLKPTVTQALLLIAILLMALIAWNTRYVVTPLRGVVTLRYDRWTGAQVMCAPVWSACKPFPPVP